MNAGARADDVEDGTWPPDFDAARCHACGSRLVDGARYCYRCGEASAAEVDVERRRLSVVFADLSGFTALAEAHEPEDVRTAVERFFALGRQAVERWGGRVEGFSGDALMAVFGDRVTREDDVERAVRAALDLRAAARTVSVPTPGRPRGNLGPTLRTHVGVATGLAVTSSGTSPSGVTSPMGDAVNVAARLQADAAPDQVLVCGTTQALLAGRVVTRDLGERVLRGRSAPVTVFEVLTDPPVPEHRSTRAPVRSRLVGRDGELALLTGAWQTLLDLGTGDALLVVAEAGGGKTRLLEELGQVVGGVPGARWLEGSARLLGETTADAPVRDLVSAAADIHDDDDEEAVRAKLARTVDRLDLVGDDVIGPLQRLYAAQDEDEAEQDRESVRTRLATAVEALLRAEAARAPTVLCVQDLHWADPSTVDLLSGLVGRLREDLLVVLSTRPGPVLDELTGAGLREVRPADLTPDELAGLLRSRLGAAVQEDVVALVAERSGGNPFFAEEVLNSLVDTAGVVAGPGGWQLAGPAAGGHVPDTVQGVIAARLDVLPSEARRFLRAASVLGSEFTLEDVQGLDAVPGPGPDLARTLQVLQDADLVRTTSGSGFRFKHSLTRDVARAGLTRPEHRRLHLAAARSLERRSGRRRTELAERLATHYREAGEVEPAVHHLGVAAEGALDRYALQEADARYRDAYRLLVGQGEPDQQVALLGPLLVRWALVHYYRGTWHRATELLVAHDAEVRGCPDPAVAGFSLAWQGFSAAIARSALDEAVRLLDDAVAIGTRLEHAELLAHACTWRAWALFLAGRHDEAVADVRRVDEACGLLEDPRFPRIKSAGALGLAHIGRGELDEAEQVAAWLVATGERTGSTRATSMGLSVRSLAAIVAGDAEAGADTGALAVASATDPIYTDMARLMAVHGMVAAGRLDGARRVHADMVDSCTTLRLDGLLLAVSSAHAVLRVLDGDLSAGMRQLEESIRRADDDGSRFLASLARVYRAAVHARVAAGTASVRPADLLRNPGFVVRHALPARRRAGAELEELLRVLPDQGGAGLCVLVAVEQERLRRAG